jgi:hypothetical protein
VRLVTKKEDEVRDQEVEFLRALVGELRSEIIGLRVQIDEVREIPPMFVPTQREARVSVMDDARMARQQRGEDPNAS